MRHARKIRDIGEIITKLKAAIFDLDGVLADTAKYHYLAWKSVASRLGFQFTPKDGERTKGVSRKESLKVVLEVGGLLGKLSEEEMAAIEMEKNSLYVGSISKIDRSELLPGTEGLLNELRRRGVAIALGSASKNSRAILDAMGIAPLFDAIVDGTKVMRAKPDPEVFLRCAEELLVPPALCAVFEDAFQGVAAAKAAGMFAVGVGARENLPNADMTIGDLSEFDANTLFEVCL
jgi:beta-phosphoglucomutase